MDYFDFNEPKEAPAPRRSSSPDMIWNVLTVVILAATLCVGGYFLTILVNPYVGLNPFPPPTLPSMAGQPTPTWTPIQLQPTWTFTPTIQPSPSMTPRPSITPVPSNTPFISTTPATATSEPATATQTPITNATQQPFAVTINTIESTIIHPESGCSWMGVGGDARDVNNNSILYLSVRLGGTLGGQTIDRLGVTGTHPMYGQGGFEWVLGNKPVASNNTLWIQLFDQAGLPLTERVFFSTFEDCTKNLVLVRFKKR